MQKLRIFVDNCKKMRYFIIKVLEKNELILLDGGCIMYINPKIYRAFSFVTFIFALFIFIASVVSVLNFTDIIDKLANIIPEIKNIGIAVQVILIIASIISLLFCYVEFSAMYAFGDMIDYRNKHTSEPMKSSAFALSPKFYSGFGSAMFYINLIGSIISAISLTVRYSIEHKAFIAIPILPIAGIVIENIYFFIHYFVRFRSISDLLRDAYGDDTAALDNNLKEIKPRHLYLYCSYYVVLSVITVIASVVLMFVLFKPVAALFDTEGAWIYVACMALIAVVSVVVNSVYGCYVDNIALMVERCQYKRNLVSYD